MRCRWILAVCSIVGGLLLSCPLLVADANPSSNNSDMEQSQEGLDQYMLSALIPAGIVVQSRIATGFEQPIAKATAVVSIITAETILAMGAIDIDQILESVPGLHVSINPIGYNPIYSFRGVYAGFNSQVLMLVDNIPPTNLSLKGPIVKELQSRILALTQLYQLPKGVLELEVTESALMNQPELIGVELSKIRKLGIKISLDDFGSGYSSLNHLKQLPVDVLKIDRLFISDIESDANDSAIVESIVCLARALRLVTVA